MGGGVSRIEVRVPDLGEFDEVDVVEVLVAQGDRIESDDSMITLESDKASMDIPAPQAGVVVEMKVEVGGKVSQGDVIAVLEVEVEVEAAGDSPPEEPSPPPGPSERRSAPEPGPSDSYDTQLLVLGSGPGGYAAAFRAADLGLSVTMVERHESLGGVCLNVGCIPSKALLHLAKVLDEAADLDGMGIHFGEPEVDLDKVRSWKSGVVGRLTKGLSGMAEKRGVEVVRGTATFSGPNSVSVQGPEGEASEAQVSCGGQRAEGHAGEASSSNAMDLSHPINSALAST